MHFNPSLLLYSVYSISPPTYKSLLSPHSESSDNSSSIPFQPLLNQNHHHEIRPFLSLCSSKHPLCLCKQGHLQSWFRIAQWRHRTGLLPGTRMYALIHFRIFANSTGCRFNTSQRRSGCSWRWCSHCWRSWRKVCADLTIFTYPLC